MGDSAVGEEPARLPVTNIHSTGGLRALPVVGVAAGTVPRSEFESHAMLDEAAGTSRMGLPNHFPR